MLVKVMYQDYSDYYNYAPPLKEAIVNTDHVICATPTESRGSGPWVKVNFIDGCHMIIQGTPEQLLGGETK